LIAIDHSAIDSKHLIELKDNLLPCDDKLGLAKYSEMFHKSIKNSAHQSVQFLDNIFNMIDSDHSGYINKNEATQAVNQMNQMLGTNYKPDLIISLDTNKDGIIDIREFKAGFSSAFGL
jgi:Ca2+-binding EF-hand superfamily protein